MAIFDTLFASYTHKRRKSYLYRLLDGKKELDLYYSNQSTSDLKENLEQRIADYIGTDFCILTPSGMSAVEWVFEELKEEMGKGTVLSPAYTCKQLYQYISKSNPVKLVDVDSKTFNSESRHFERESSHYWNVIHGWGNPVEMDEILDTAKRKKKIIFEDCAHSFGSTYKGKRTGSFGEVSVLSFRKNLAMQYGGAICTSNAKLASKFFKRQKKFPNSKLKDLFGISALMLRRHAKKDVFPYMLHAKMSPDSSKTNYNNLTRLALCIGIIQLKHIDFHLEQAEENAKFLKKKLANKNLFFQEVHKNANPNYTRFAVGFKGGKENRNLALEELQKERFDTGLCYSEDFEKNILQANENKMKFPNSIFVANKVLPVAILNQKMPDLKVMAEIIHKHTL